MVPPGRLEVVRLTRREWFALVFSLAVLATVAVFLFFGGSSEGSVGVIDLVGAGHSATFSQSEVTIHPGKGEICPGEDAIYWQNETDSTQQVVEIDGQPVDEDATIPAGQGLGACEAPGTYIFSLQSNPSARVLITAGSS